MRKSDSTYHLIFATLLGVSAGLAAGQVVPPKTEPNPFAVPLAKHHFAPDRMYDLLHVAIKLDVDYPSRTIRGSVTNTITCLVGGMGTAVLHAGKDLQVSQVKVNGGLVKFSHQGDELRIALPNMNRGAEARIAVQYSASKTKGGTFGAGGGWHWIEPDGEDPHRVGFWTQGETMYNRNWVPTWDYPNDFATSESTVTVDKDWTVVGNGALESNMLQTTRRTFHWRMKQPHATYLISLVGGPFDVKTDVWQSVPLWYVVPRGKGHLIEDSFGDTKDMLSFFSGITGVRYPWPKYAQNAMHDFGGGMENVSSTTLGAGALTNRRQGFRTMSGLNAHELAHQWFGDLVTCRDWGHIWLNESFATFFGALYTEHARGKPAYEHEINGDITGYLEEAKRYIRPLATNLYPEPDRMFDSHSYPKGAAVLHTLRRWLGDARFFAGIRLYLERNRHRPVTTNDLQDAMTDASGINCEPFFAQWVYRQGHPIISWKWSWDAASSEVVVKVTQGPYPIDIRDGSPEQLPPYRWRVEIGLVKGRVDRRWIEMKELEEEFRLKAPAKPDAVLFDPDHEFLRELKNQWGQDELPTILEHAPCAVDRQEAFKQLTMFVRTDAAARLAESILRKDAALHPVITDSSHLAMLEREDLRPLWLSELKHPNMGRQAQAVHALARLPVQPATVAALTALVNNVAGYEVVVAALQALGRWEPASHVETFRRAATMDSPGEMIRRHAFYNLVHAKAPEAIDLLVRSSTGRSAQLRSAAFDAMAALPPGEPKSLAALKKGLGDRNEEVLLTVARVVDIRKEKSLAGDLKEAVDRTTSPWLKQELQHRLDELGK